MPSFTYKAVSASGEIVEGVIDAQDRDAVVERLRRQGHVPIRADERKGFSLRALNVDITPRSKRIAAKDVALLTRELTMLLQAGLPLDRALTILGDLTPAGPTRAMVEQVLEKVRGGATFADALETYDDAFPNFYSGLVRAGEAGGTLDSVLERLSETLERSQKLKETVRSALIYPIIVVVVAVFALGILMTLVIPEFRPLFEDAGTELPLLTRIVIGVSDFVGAYWWALLAAVLAFVLLLRAHNRTEAGRMRWDRWVLGLPLFGGLVRKIEVARFSRTLGTLLSNGVTVLNAMAMTTETLENRALALAVGEVRGRLAKGEGLAQPLTESGQFPHLALQLIHVGDESGQLEQMLIRVADIYDVEVERTIQRLLALLVPVITIVLGILIALIIGSIVSAMLSAYDLPV